MTWLSYWLAELLCYCKKKGYPFVLTKLDEVARGNEKCMEVEAMQLYFKNGDDVFYNDLRNEKSYVGVTYEIWFTCHFTQY